MEFDMLCVHRMRKLLSDLSSSVESVLNNGHNSPIMGTTCDDKMSDPARGLVRHLRMFNELVDARMKITPLEKLKRDECVRNSIANLKCALDEVKALESELEEERSRHEQMIRSIYNEIAEENLNREKIMTRHAREMAETISKSNDEIAKIEEETNLKTKRLEMEIGASKNRLEDTSRTNLIRERELYGKRSKAENCYLAILAKYDDEVGELHRTMRILAEELNSLDEILVDLRDRVVIQDVQYVRLKNEREMAILKAFTEDLENFKKTRAARIIQKAWRCFYERCCVRRKRKSKKKKGSTC